MTILRTHQSIERGYDISAWRLSDTASSIPLWVARTFHRINGQWQALTTDRKLLAARDGDWVVTSAETAGKCYVLTDVEFHKLFRPLTAPAGAKR